MENISTDNSEYDFIKRHFPKLDRRVERFVDITLNEGFGAAIRNTYGFAKNAARLKIRQLKNSLEIMSLRYGQAQMLQPMNYSNTTPDGYFPFAPVDIEFMKHTINHPAMKNMEAEIVDLERDCEETRRALDKLHQT